MLVCCSSEGTSDTRTDDDLLSILSEDPPGETVTLVVSKANPLTFLFIRTEGRTTRGVHDSVGVMLGKSKAIFSLILMLVIRFRLIILNEERAKEISDSLGDLIFASITDKGIHGSPFSDVVNRSLLSSGGLMADVPCLDYSLDDCKGYPDDVQTTKHARRMYAWSRCARTSLGAHVSPFGASSARFGTVTRAMSARIEEPSMASNLCIKPSVPNIYK